MDNPSYYIPAEHGKDFSLASMGEFCECSKCKRKILVSMGLIGTIHHCYLDAICADCLEVYEEFRKEHPSIAEQIDKWKAGEDISKWKQKIFIQNEEIPDGKWTTEYSPIVPGTLTGKVLVDDKVIQTFTTTIEGDLNLLSSIGSMDNSIQKGSYKDYKWNLEWAKPEVPSFKLVISYEYE